MKEANKLVLVVEDDPDIRLFLSMSLNAAGFAVAAVGTGREAFARAADDSLALAIVDLGLPDMDGTDVVRRLRTTSEIPIIILSARTDERQKIRGLDAGADDYLTKPLGIGELMARIRAALRRAGANGEAVYERDGLAIDLERRRVRRHGEDVHLTQTEFKLLARLVRNRGQVVTHRQLLADVWGPEFVEHTHYLRIYMGQLRAKIEANPADPPVSLDRNRRRLPACRRLNVFMRSLCGRGQACSSFQSPYAHEFPNQKARHRRAGAGGPWRRLRRHRHQPALHHP